MKTLLLSRCELITTQGIAHVGTLTQLEVLGLNHCTSVGYEALSSFQRLKNLRTLEMAYVSVDTAGKGFATLARLKALRELQIRMISSRGMDLSDDAFGAIRLLTQLSSLHISDASVRDSICGCQLRKIDFPDSSFYDVLSVRSTANIASVARKDDQLNLSKGRGKQYQ
jgi:hypothetical protein